MRKYAIFCFVLCLIIVSIVAIPKTRYLKAPTLFNSKTSSAVRIKHSSHLFDPAFFSQAYDKGLQYKKVASSEVLGGILPHHLVAAPLIAGFFEGVANQKITTVILLSPNHYGLGPYDISTSKGVWTTIFGDLNTDTSKIEQLERDKTAFVTEDLFNTEHGIYGITPFIKKSFPDAKMVPVVIKGGISKTECDQLVQSLNKIIDDHTIIIVSSDFSHYLPSDQADLHDKQSIPAIESFNTDKVFSSDHVKDIDSPESVYALLKVMQLKKATNPIFLANSNSAKLTGQLDVQSTTSYLTMYFTKSESVKPSPLSLEKIFDKNHSWISTLPQNKIRTMIATGDVIPARSVNFQVLSHKDFKWPYLKTADITRNADITFINLETPLIGKCQPTQEGMIFCGNIRNVEGLVYAGVNVASLANNHAGNYGAEGVQETVDLLNKNNILVTGVNGSAIKNVRGMKFAFLGYNDITRPQPGISNTDDEKIKTEIAEAKKQADVVVVTFHWGIEYQDQPDDRQKYLGHLAIDSGADLVIGNHPHWIEPVEIYKGKLIAYAHGNFVFDQMWSEKTREGVIGKYTFYDNQLIDVEYLPVQIDSYGQPYFVEAGKKDSMLANMRAESLKLSSIQLVAK